MKKMNKKFGFTLVELLVVISIVAILVVATSSSFVTSQQKSRDASKKSELKSLADALNMYFADKGSFPTSTIMSGLISTQGEFSNTTKSGNKVIYMKKVPIGNSSGSLKLSYEVSSTGKSFRLFTNLENTGDRDCIEKSKCRTLGYMISNGCCYVITSSNIGSTDLIGNFP
jgi:prepilin-type N-terminal cleavage/methylation domain-containing protein